MNEEPFGPVAVMMRFKDTDDVLERANKLALRPRELRLHARTPRPRPRSPTRSTRGMVTINHLGLALPEMPFGGVKDSGYGHEGGAEGLQVYHAAQKIVSQLG